MRFNEIIVESKKVNEAPMGMMSRAGRGIAAKLGHRKSKGMLDTGNTANAVRGEYDEYLGQTGEQPSAENVIAFLHHKGWPTQGAAQVLQGAGGPNTQGPMDPNAPKAKVDPNAQAGGEKKPGLMSKLKQKFSGGGAANAAADTGADAQQTGRVEPSMDDPAAGNAQPTNTQTQPATTQAQPTNTQTPPAQTQTPPADPNAARKAELQAKLKAQMQPVGLTGKGNKARKRLGKLGKAAQTKSSGSQGVLDLNSMYTEDAIPSNLVDKALLRAVQDARRLGLDTSGSDMQGGDQQGAGGQQQGGGDDDQGYMSGAKNAFKQAAGMGGKPGAEDPTAQKQGSLNINQLSQLLPNVNPNQLRRASAMVLQGGKLNQQALAVLGHAFGEVLKADPQTTMKVMRLLKQVSA